MDLRRIAKHYLRSGLSVIPTNKHKQPIADWTIFQKRFMTDEEVEKYFTNSDGIGIVCGEISGAGKCLTVIDLDVKYFDDSITYEAICKSIPSEIFNKLVIGTTRSSGYHWYFRSDIKTNNKKYALRPASEAEKLNHPKERVLVLLENRCEGGMVCAYGTEGYNIISNNKKINILTNEEHQIITDVLGSFNRIWDSASFYEQFIAEKESQFLLSPFEDYDKRGDLLSLLLSHGYSIMGNANLDKVKIKRPGNTVSHSGYYLAQENRYLNFSTSGVLEGSKGYSASQVFTLLECQNWSDSYHKLLNKGYGVGVNFDNKVKEFVKAYRDGDLFQLLYLHFNAKKTTTGVEINNKIFNIKL